MNDAAAGSGQPQPYEQPKPAFGLKQMVKIDETKVNGTVVGIYLDAYGDTRYIVRYFNDNKEKREQYFVAGELVAL